MPEERRKREEYVMKRDSPQGAERNERYSAKRKKSE